MSKLLKTMLEMQQVVYDPVYRDLKARKDLIELYKGCPQKRKLALFRRIIKNLKPGTFA